MDLNLTFKHLKKEEEKLAKELKEYAHSKLNKIEDYLPTHARKSAKLEAVLDENDKKSKGFRFRFEVKLKLPEKSIVSSFKAETAEEAINKAEKKLMMQLRKYKTQHTAKNMNKKTLAKLRRVLKRG
jgi:ribosomal subunit interface protein